MSTSPGPNGSGRFNAGAAPPGEIVGDPVDGACLSELITGGSRASTNSVDAVKNLLKYFLNIYWFAFACETSASIIDKCRAWCYDLSHALRISIAKTATNPKSARYSR